MRPASSAEARWRLIVDEQRASGLSAAAFCEQRGLATSTFFAWKRRLGEAGALAPDVGSGFVEARVVASSPLEAAGREAGGVMEVELRDGGRPVLILRPGFDAGLLREVLAALSGERGGEPR